MVSAVQACREADISYRQLDYWVRRGVVLAEPSAGGSGFPRAFTEDEVRVLRVVAALRALGCGLDTCSEVAVQLRDWPESEWHGFVFVDALAGLQRKPCNGCTVIDLDAILDVGSGHGEHAVVVEGVSHR